MNRLVRRALRRIHEKRCYEYHFVGGEGGKSL